MMLENLWPPKLWKDIKELHKAIDFLQMLDQEKVERIEELEDEVSTLKAAQKIHNKEIGFSPVSTESVLEAARRVNKTLKTSMYYCADRDAWFLNDRS